MEDGFSQDSEEQPPVFCMQTANSSHLQASSSGPKLGSVRCSLSLRKCTPLSIVCPGAPLSQCHHCCSALAPRWSRAAGRLRQTSSAPSQSSQPEASQQCTPASPAKGCWLHRSSHSGETPGKEPAIFAGRTEAPAETWRVRQREQFQAREQHVQRREAREQGV